MPRFTRFIFLILAIGALQGASLGAPEKETTTHTPPKPTILEKYVVSSSRTDVALWPEEIPDTFPFGRTGIFGEFLTTENRDPGAELLRQELASLTDNRQMDFVSISGGSTPRGFTAPRLRNGQTQLGFPEQIVGGRRDLLTGFMAILYGRTAPGGIVNLISRRPAPNPALQFETQVSSRPSLFIQTEGTRVLINNKLSGGLFANASMLEGPEAFTKREEGTATTSLRYADKKNVVLWELEAVQTRAVPAPGIPLTREVPGGLIGLPYLPLAAFNTNGPEAWARRTSYSTSIWAQRKLDRGWSLRGGGQWWKRSQNELRFITGPYVLSTGLFDGTRQPQYNHRDDSTLGAQIEIDIPVKNRRVDQRWLAGIEGSHALTTNLRRALTTATRNALPASIRFFNPTIPDFTTPTYSTDTYANLQTLRDESTNYIGAFVSDRLSWAKGRYGATFGLRQDWVSAVIDDRLPLAQIPKASFLRQKTTYHLGWVGQFGPRLAVFANHSTAFQPQRRVDARTGRIQGNESTSGIETGLRWQTPEKKVQVTAVFYRLWNQNITRRNPLYDDPVLDADRTQPQLASSGRERFTSIENNVRWELTRSFSTELRGTWLEAVTTSSPDLPEEEGRQLPRTPKYTGSLSLNWRAAPTGLGWQWGIAYAWIGSQVAMYPNATRVLWRCDGYGLVVLNSGYAWEQKKRRYSAGLAVRNALNQDLLSVAGRLGGERVVEARFGVRL